MSSKSAILCIGDSRTYGTGAVNGTSDWPTQLGALTATGGGLISAAWDIDNRGVPGRLLDEIANSLMDVLVMPDASSLRTTVAWLWAGVNDQNATGAQLLTWTTTFATQVRSTVMKVGIILELPTIDATRLAILNNGILSLLSNGNVDYVARTDQVADLQNTSSAAYAAGNLPHLTAYGYGLIAGCVKTAQGL